MSAIPGIDEVAPEMKAVTDTDHPVLPFPAPGRGLILPAAWEPQEALCQPKPVWPTHTPGPLTGEGGSDPGGGPLPQHPWGPWLNQVLPAWSADPQLHC